MSLPKHKPIIIEKDVQLHRKHHRELLDSDCAYLKHFEATKCELLQSAILHKHFSKAKFLMEQGAQLATNVPVRNFHLFCLQIQIQKPTFFSLYHIVQLILREMAYSLEHADLFAPFLSVLKCLSYVTLGYNMKNVHFYLGNLHDPRFKIFEEANEQASVDRAAFHFLKYQMTEYCFALQELQLPAWCTVSILQETSEPFTAKLYDIWRLVTKIKHFKD